MTDITVPNIPDMEQVVRIATQPFSNPTTQRTYRSCLKDFMEWKGSRPFNDITITDYRQHLVAEGFTPSTINTRLTAIRKLAEQALHYKLLDPQITKDIMSVAGVKNSGVRSGNWLTREEANKLLAAPDTSTLRGLRDKAVLSVLLGAGLRRREVAQLTVDKLAERDNRWVILDINGKGNKIRTVPIPNWCYHNIQRWLDESGITEGRVFVPILKNEPSGTSVSEQTVYNIVAQYAKLLHKTVGAHDLRRTFAKLAYQGGARLDQIQFSLGHASIRTTEMYLGVQQDITDAPCDYVGLMG